MLEDMNPWWRWKNWEEKDIDLIKFKDFKINWVPSWIKEISLQPFSLNFVLGPRQVGKTTGIKLLVSYLIKNKVECNSIIYVNCDLLASFKELRKLLEKVRKYRFIILDEVTSIEYWWKVIKGFIDLGFFKDSVLIVSGSSFIKVGKFIESFTGRRGKGKDVTVLPLDFKNFVKLLGYKKYQLNEALREYFKLGGFPRSINRDPTFFQDFIGSIEKEFARIDKSYKIAREIIYQIILKAPSSLSYNTIGNSIGISHVTVRDYLEVMEDLFLLKIAYHKEKRKINFRKDKKIFLRDPFILQAFSTALDVTPRGGTLHEWVVQEHLYRKFGEIYYWKNKVEIDCIANGLKIEVKVGKPSRRYPKGVSIIEEENLPNFLYKLQ
ncbi:MAG TPA: ATP-binding protein [Candidatus Aenigmarchaeota archaeon]|nr:ATP-binding protein [Candidatus Aenigmarchaeota archaeon]